MTTSQRTFEQVKNILGKLDRNIDAARAKRLHGDAPVPAIAAPPAVSPIASASPQRPMTPPMSTATPLIPNPAQPGRSAYGRAQPMRRPDPRPLPKTGT